REFRLSVSASSREWLARDAFNSTTDLEGGACQANIRFTFSPDREFPAQLDILPGTRFDLFGGDCRLLARMSLPLDDQPRSGLGLHEFLWRAEGVSLPRLARGLRGGME